MLAAVIHRVTGAINELPIYSSGLVQPFFFLVVRAPVVRPIQAKRVLGNEGRGIVFVLTLLLLIA